MTLEFTLPVLLPMLNAWERMHWATRKRWKTDLAAMLAPVAEGAAWDTPAKQARITITRCSSRAPDPDNLTASAKPLLDALQPPGGRHKYGVGLIADDSPKHLTLVVEHERSTASCTRVRIERIE